jgi:hypothetical protein
LFICIFCPITPKTQYLIIISPSPQAAARLESYAVICACRKCCFINTEQTIIIIGTLMIAVSSTKAASIAEAALRN